MLSVVVAAKDEQANIEKCVRTILDQDYPNLELIVCNDRSTDATGEIVERIAAGDSRVKAINIAELPEGWAGKNHAMQKGIAAARGQWICMTDADCRLSSPQTLTAAMQYAGDSGADMISVLPTLEMRGFWEHLLQPVFCGLLMMWFPPGKVNDPAKPHAYANGMFMLISRSAYEAIGTHEAIKGSLIEDMDMARGIKSGGLSLRMVPSEDMVSVRMYTSLREIFRGWTRIYIGTFPNLPRLMLAWLAMVGKGLTCYVAAAVGLGMYAAGGGQWWLACGLVGAAGAVAETVMVARYLRHVGSWGSLGLLYPLASAMTATILVRSMLLRFPGGQIVWRDTSYAAKRRR
jgi:glycosyltransferase involved in cell wall biosynthesis